MSQQELTEVSLAIENIITCLKKFGTEFSEEIESLIDLKLKLNEPRPIINTSENIQQTKNVIDTQNIVNNEL